MHFQNPPTYDGKNLLTTTQAGQPRAGAVGHHRRHLHLRPGNAELVPLHLQPPARQSRTDGYPDQSDAARRQHVQRGAELPAVRRYRRLQHLLRNLRPGTFQRQRFQVADDVDVIRGRHQMAFGFNLIRVQNNTISGFHENGNFTFNGSRTGAAAWPISCSDVPNDFTQTNATPDDLRHG